MAQSTGTLYLVSTPIGNRDDLSPRATQVLSSSSYVLCESIEQTRKLVIARSLFEPEPQSRRPEPVEGRRGNLDHMKTDRHGHARRDLAMTFEPHPVPLFRYEGKGFKGEAQRAKVLEDLRNGRSVALVSNAGTPLISDPGLSLVQTVIQNGFSVVHIPGLVAFVSAVVTSGLPTKNILFIGYLPKKERAIEKKFECMKSSLQTLDEPASLVCYVSKYQLRRALDGVKHVFGDSIIVNLARELTKLYEEHKTGNIDEIIRWVSESKNREKGEFTLTISLL